MSNLPTPAAFTDADYEMIAAAVLETARGRWFLTEHARRNRNADTKLVLEAIEKLERSLGQRASAVPSDQMRLDLVDMMNAINRTKAEIAAIKPATRGGQIDEASNELDSIIGSTEKATSDILAATERVEAISRTLREQGTNEAVCDLVEANAAEIYSACSFQDLTGQRIRKVIDVLRFLEARIDTMIKIWRFHDRELAAENAKHAPRLNSQEQTQRQQAIDEIFGDNENQNVVWRKGQTEGSRDPRNLGEFDLDDLVVFEAAPELRPELADEASGTTSSPPPQPETELQAAQETQAKPAAQHPGERCGITLLSFTERMALFT